MAKLAMIYSTVELYSFPTIIDYHHARSGVSRKGIVGLTRRDLQYLAAMLLSVVSFRQSFRQVHGGGARILTFVSLLNLPTSDVLSYSRGGIG